MLNGSSNKFAVALKSLWQAENAIRRAALNGIVFRKAAASAQVVEARRHFGDALNAIRSQDPPAGPPTIRQ